MRNIIFTFLFLTVFTSLFSQDVKVIQWYNMLHEQGITDFEAKEESKNVTEDKIEEDKK